MSDIKRSLLIMRYDMSMTLSENIQEQLLLGGPAMFGGPTGGLNLADKLLPNWSDDHSVLQWVELTTGILGLIPTPASPFLLAISTTAGIADAYKYLKEGDPYTASIYFALSIVPLGELMAVLKKNPVFRNLSVQSAKTLIELFKTGKISKKQLEILKDVFKGFKNSAPEINTLTKKTILSKFISSLSKMTPKIVLSTYSKLHKLKVISLGKLMVNVLGLPIAADKLYVWINRDLLNDKQNMIIRENNDLLFTWRYLRKKYLEGYTDEQLKNELIKQTESQLNEALEKFNGDLVQFNQPIPETESERKQQVQEFLNRYRQGYGTIIKPDEKQNKKNYPEWGIK